MRSARGSSAAAVSVLLALAAVFADEPARWLVVTDPPRWADAAVVLAGDPDYERTRSAVRLLLGGQVGLLILTGGEPGPGDSATSLRDVALRAGVPAERIRMEQVSSSTRGSMEAIRPILEQEGIRSVAVVTSPYHQRRASWTARRTLRGVAVVSRPADPAGWRPEGWWKTRWNRRIVLGEYAKLAYYVLRGWA
ncbi:MAG TPA: YdcF family protein [Vicinamibacteria bacterium]|nr:YdcF family protein [Vicinamibacteria bacterium]